MPRAAWCSHERIRCYRPNVRRRYRPDYTHMPALKCQQLIYTAAVGRASLVCAHHTFPLYVDVPEQQEEQEEAGNACTICLDFMAEKGERRPVALKCGHIFCEKCIRHWLQANKRCPQCNQRYAAHTLCGTSKECGSWLPVRKPGFNLKEHCHLNDIAVQTLLSGIIGHGQALSQHTHTPCSCRAKEYHITPLYNLPKVAQVDTSYSAELERKLEEEKREREKMQNMVKVRSS